MERPYNPTEREIELACEAIQATWTDATRLARIADDHVRSELTGHYTVPEISASYLLEDRSNDQA